RRHLADRLQGLLTAPRPELLATADERLVLERLAQLEKGLGSSRGAEAAALRARATRLRGLITWRLVTEYDTRLTEAFTHLEELKGDAATLNQPYQACGRPRQA